MAKSNRKVVVKKTRQGNSTNTKTSQPGPKGGAKKYKKKYKGQGKK